MKKAFDGCIFLWKFLVAWKTDKEHNEDFITKQWSILATSSQTLASASASAVVTGQAFSKALHANMRCSINPEPQEELEQLQPSVQILKQTFAKVGTSRVDTSCGQHPIGAKVAANADIRGTSPGPTAASGTTMCGECNATASAGASANAKVVQDINGEHQKRKCTMIPINDSFLNNNSDADGDYTEGSGKAKHGKEQPEFHKSSQTMAQQGMMPNLERREKAGTVVEAIRKMRPTMMRRRFNPANHAHCLSEVKEC